MLTVYIGAPLQLAGVMNIDGAPGDFTNWSLTANLYDAAAELISPLTVTWIDASKGLVTISAPSTSAWAACKARIDCRLVTPTGDIVLGPPMFLRIAQSPMS
ncbi:hypothetical protein DBA20_16575 [Pandoraea capi]|nr:hypothetical protein [Pandoraea sp. LA3]MDN4584601.1 hypothetical protein [Pandoraea capi]